MLSQARGPPARTAGHTCRLSPLRGPRGLLSLHSRTVGMSPEQGAKTRSPLTSCLRALSLSHVDATLGGGGALQDSKLMLPAGGPSHVQGHTPHQGRRRSLASP